MMGQEMDLRHCALLLGDKQEPREASLVEMFSLFPLSSTLVSLRCFVEHSSSERRRNKLKIHSTSFQDTETANQSSSIASCCFCGAVEQTCSGTTNPLHASTPHAHPTSHSNHRQRQAARELSLDIPRTPNPLRTERPPPCRHTHCWMGREERPVLELNQKPSRMSLRVVS